MQKLISIIIPIYDVQCYLRKCIDSVINQTYKNLEIILVDDESPDNCGKICDEYAKKDNRIKVIHKKNGGLSSARNAGLDVCTGEYVSFIDSDDFVDEKYIEELYNMLEKNNVDISIANRYKVQDDNIEECKYYSCIEKQMNSKQLLIEYFRDNLPHEAWGKLYKKEIFNNSRYQDGLRIFEDLKFIYELLLSKDLKIYCDTTKFLYYYRNREDSLMKTGFDEHWKAELDFYKDIFIKLSEEDRKELAYVYTNVCLRNFSKVTKELSYTNKQLVAEIKEIQKHLKLMKKYAYIAKGKKRKLKIFIIKYLKELLIIKNKIKRKEANKFRKQFNKYYETQNKNKQKLYLIFNGPTTGNIGDHAIIYGEEKVLQDRGINYFRVSAKEMIYFFKMNLNKKVSESDYIFITGGGNVGSLWRNEQERINKVLNDFKNNKIIVFPQTVYYHENEFGDMCLELDCKYYNGCKDLTIYARDEKTYKFLNEKLKIKTELVKDMALNLDYRKTNNNRNGIVFCIRNDKEKNVDSEQMEKLVKEIKQKYPQDTITFMDTVIKTKQEFSYKDGKKEFIKIIKLFQNSKLVVTDRLHGMIMSVITDTPCIAMNNTSGKVKGVYETIKNDNVKVEFRDL